LYNPDNLQPGTIYRLPVYLIPFWWQTMAFKVMAVIFLLAFGVLMIVWMFRYRLRQERLQLEKQLAVQRERERIITDLHDDIGATLSSMHIYGDLASQVLDTEPVQSRKMMEKISATSRNLMARMGDIIWSMKPADELNFSLETRLKNYCNELLAPKSVAFGFDIDQQLAESISHPEVRKNILLIAKEAINNTAKYSECTEVFISLTQQGNHIILIIRDNGKGFTPDKKNPGNGLQNIRRRCLKLQGACSIETEPGGGALVKCTFPIAIISYTT
jgi:signal transduction histidine kinase